MARLVSPSEFGTYALCTAIVGLTVAFVISATERALIIESDTDYHGLTMSCFILGLLGSTIGLVFGAIVATTHLLNIRLELLCILLFCSLMTSTIIPVKIFFRRNLKYGIIVSCELLGLTLGCGLVAIYLASLGWGYYAIASGVVVQNAVTVIIMLFYSRKLISVSIVPRSIKNLLLKTLGVTRLTAVEVLHFQIPSVFIGHIGAVPLGLYNRAQTIVQLPAQLITASILRVMISKLKSNIGDKSLSRLNAKTMISISGCLLASINGGIAGSSKEFTQVLLGSGWSYVGDIVPLLAFTSWSTMTAWMIAIVSEADGRFKEKAKIQLISSAITLITLLPLLHLGVVGVITSLAIGAFVLLTLNIILTSRTLQISLFTVGAWILPGIGLGVVCLCLTRQISTFMSGQSSAVVLGLQIVGCGIALVAFLVTTEWTLVRSVLSTISLRRSERRTADSGFDSEK